MNFLQRIFLPLGGLLALCSCSGTDILNLTIPRSGYSIQRDIAYGEDVRQQLDVYIPDKRAAGNPVILFFYGGSWQSGSKKDYLFVGEAFASKGFTTIIADYRLYPQVYFPAFMEDAARAFVWTHQYIAGYGGNNQNIFVSGHSAGGYMALMLTLNTAYIKDAGGDPAWIKGAIGIAGAYDFLPFTDPKIKAIFSQCPDSQTQPVTYVRQGTPPILLLTGDKDRDVLPRNAIRLTEALRATGDNVETHIYPGLAHVGIILSLARGFRGKSPALADITRFVNHNNFHYQ